MTEEEPSQEQTAWKLFSYVQSICLAAPLFTVKHLLNCCCFVFVFFKSEGSRYADLLLNTHVEGLRFLISISELGSLHTVSSIWPPLSAEHITDIFQSGALLSLQSQCHCSPHVVESSFDRVLWWITWLRLLEKKHLDPIALSFFS